MSDYRNPTPTVDVIIEVDNQIVWIRRANEPKGWALPGGFVDEGETVEEAACREAREETGLIVQLDQLLYVYSHPSRDRRQHNLSVVFTAQAQGTPKGADDAAEARLFPVDEPPENTVFDHLEILSDYRMFKTTGRRPTPVDYLRRHEP